MHKKLVVNGPFADRKLSTFKPNLSFPRHRWYNFKEGFSRTIVEEALQEFKRKDIRVLDPFSGCGTTLLTCAENGVDCTGIEVNPFLAFVSNVKLTKGNWKLRRYNNYVSDLLNATNKTKKSPLEAISTFSSDGRNRQKWLFNKSVLRAFTSINDKLGQSKSIYSNPLRLALFGAAMDCCNGKRDGKCLRYKKDWQFLSYSANDLLRILEDRSRIIFSDAMTVPIKNITGTKCVLGDARNYLRYISSNTYDLVVTSPPYLNSSDYCDVYRPELFLGGFVKNNAELRELRLRTVRSHVQVKWIPTKMVRSKLLNKTVQRVTKGERLWDPRIPEMIQGYFDDLEVILIELARVVRKKGKAWLVVGTSAYAGVEVPVDLILAEIASNSGWEVDSVHVLRELRAAGQQWSSLNSGKGLPLRESLIILNRQ